MNIPDTFHQNSLKNAYICKCATASQVDMHRDGHPIILCLTLCVAAVTINITKKYNVQFTVHVQIKSPFSYVKVNTFIYVPPPPFPIFLVYRKPGTTRTQIYVIPRKNHARRLSISWKGTSSSFLISLFSSAQS